MLPWIPSSVCHWRSCIEVDGKGYDVDRLLVGPEAAELPSPSGCHPVAGGQTARAHEESEPPLVSFIYTIHNNPIMAAKGLLATFRTAHEVSSAEFVLVDDFSIQDMSVFVRVAEALESVFGARIVKRRTPRVLGYTNVNTLALRLASGTYACLMNTDVYPLPGWLGAIYHTLRTFPGAGMVGPMQVSQKARVMEAGGTVFRQGHPYNIGRALWPWELPFLHSHVVDYISAACLLFNRTMFLGLGLFDPRFAPAYFEDTDAGLAVRGSGKLVVSVPLAVVVHTEGGSHSSIQKEKQMKANQEKFAEKHAQALELHCPSPRGWAQTCRDQVLVRKAVLFNTIRRQGFQVLVMDALVPEVDRDSGSVRMRELLEMMVQMGYGVTMQSRHAISSLKYVIPLLGLGVHVLSPGFLEQMARETKHEVSKLASCPWQVAILSRRSVFKTMIEPLRKVCPTIPVIYDTVDIHFVRERRSAELALKTDDKAPVFLGDKFVYVNSTPREEIDQILLDAEQLEVSFMNMSAFVLVVGSGEVDLAGQKTGKEKVRLLTNIYPDPNRTVTGSSFKERKGGLFVGSMCHTPNMDAARFIMRDILPANGTSFPAGFMHMVWSGTSKCGHLMGNLMEEAQSHPLVTLHLDISNEELQELHLSTKFFLGALRVGAGVKGKICHALLYGLPIVASEIATEGMFLKNGLNVLAAESPTSYREAIDQLISNETLWHSLREGGYQVIEERFSRGAARSTLREVFAALGVEPRVRSDGAGKDDDFRAATATWECPLPANDDGKLGMFPGRQESDCWTSDRNPWVLLGPMEPYDDKFLRDHLRGSKLNIPVPLTCPTSALPTIRRPFIYHHIMKTGGLTIRQVVAQGATSHDLTTAIPCVGSCDCRCNIVYNTPLSETSTCLESEQFKLAAVYLGHFAPLALARFRPALNSDKLCFVMIRNPLDRAVSHYSRFGVKDQFRGTPMDELSLDQMEDAIRRIGGGEYMTRYMGCIDDEACSEPMSKIMKVAQAEMRRCHLGLTDQFKTTLAYLKILLPWLDLDSIADFHARPANYVDGRELLQRISSDAEKKEAVSRWFAADSELFDYGRGLFYNQTKHALRCYTADPIEDEAARLKELRAVSRKVKRKPEAYQWDVANCLERAVSCREGPLKDLCGCTPSESE